MLELTHVNRLACSFECWLDASTIHRVRRETSHCDKPLQPYNLVYLAFWATEHVPREHHLAKLPSEATHSGAQLMDQGVNEVQLCGPRYLFGPAGGASSP